MPFITRKTFSRTVQENALDEDKDGMQLSQTTSETLKRHGININQKMDPSKCKENEIFLMDKNKMFLVSSEKIVHDISGNERSLISSEIKLLE